MLETRDEWINLFFDNVRNKRGIDKPAFEEGIKWLYNDLLKKPTPKIIYCDGWLSCLLTIAILKNKNLIKKSWASVRASVRASVWDSVGAPVGASIMASVRASAWDSVGAPVGDSAWDSVKASVWDSVGAPVWDSVKASIGDSIGDSVGDSIRASVGDSIGASVGDSVWASVGASVWAPVWDSVKASIGDSIGDSVGDSIRASVGDSIGDSVGDSIRASVGDSVWASVGASVWDSVGDSVRDSIRASVGASVGDSVRDSVGDSVGDSIRASVWASVRASVRASVGDSIRASVGDSIRASVNEYSSYIDLSNYGWVSFYDFFEKINLLDNFNFKQYKKLIRSNVFNAYEYENYVFAIQPPVYIETNLAGRLHSTTQAAVQFRDGSEYYFINGRSIPAWIVNDKSSITKERFMKETDADIKGAIYESIGQQGMLDLLGAKVVDRREIVHANGDREVVELLKTDDLFKEIDNQPFAWVSMCCPSTGTHYLQGVEPHHTNAIEAIASLSPFNAKDYSFNFRA